MCLLLLLDQKQILRIILAKVLKGKLSLSVYAAEISAPRPLTAAKLWRLGYNWPAILDQSPPATNRKRADRTGNMYCTKARQATETRIEMFTCLV